MPGTDGFADGRGGSPDAREAQSSFSEVLAECGGLATRLVELHTDDGTGRCRACVRTNRASEAHPCRIRSVATGALHLQASRVAGTVLPKQGPGPAL